MARKTSTKSAKTASRMIDQRVRELDDWRGSVLERVRRLIHEADPEVALTRQRRSKN